MWLSVLAIDWRHAFIADLQFTLQAYPGTSGGEEIPEPRSQQRRCKGRGGEVPSVSETGARTLGLAAFDSLTSSEASKPPKAMEGGSRRTRNRLWGRDLETCGSKLLLAPWHAESSAAAGLEARSSRVPFAVSRSFYAAQCRDELAASG